MTSTVDSISLIRLDPELPIPVRAHDTDAGIDLHASEFAPIAPGAWRLIGTGIAIALPMVIMRLEA